MSSTAVSLAAGTKTGRWVLLVVAATLVLVPLAVALLPFSVVLAMGSSTATAFTGACLGGAATVAASQTVDGYGHDQLVIAATIIQVGRAQGVDVHGQQVAVMTAMGESSLQNLNHGDAVDNTTIGVFQQGAAYGTRPQRLDPATAAAAFYTRMLTIPGWEAMDPSLLAHRVQVNADPNHYTAFYKPAGDVIAALTGTTPASCQVPADAAAAAKLLVAAIAAGKLTFLESRYEQQVISMADGTATANCLLDVHVLQVMVIAVNNFQQVGISDLNRRCTGETPGAGTSSAHWQGKAVDFYALNHQSLTGEDDLSIQLIRLIDPYVPHGSGLGQSNIRAANGDPITGLKNFTLQFADTGDHQHIQVP
ncbi:hypothetical protein HII28_13215 [Planctomonas sp. JC2975]|uniref:hypothetical protein n=1 Tax=Planctomonas sp. JC2975 TaxID=2729626 RepID=UPI001473A253|nr:hypothetical protein [Planctomonas sp. JC2975]NNC12834.1 hypothetical protein [Planctomonas sp. JC2975]